MKSIFYLAWRYLAYHWVKTAILVTSIMLIVYLPVTLRILIDQSANELTARAEHTPLLVGARGSPLELSLNSLYFESDMPELTSYRQAIRIRDTGLADPIPLYVRFQARGFPIVGTTLDYLDFRKLELAEGRRMGMLGECVVGSRVAGELGLAPGDSLVSSPESVFDLAGVYPLQMKVVGVLDPSHSPDDLAVFVDIKTAWIIQGLGHGHQDLAQPEARSGVLSRDGNTIRANASVKQYNEITADNMDSFHFHGDLSDYPVSGVIAVPHDEKSRVILMGRFEGEEETDQIVDPATVLDELLDTVLTIQNYVVAAILLVGVSALATAALVFMLSLRLRRREIDTMVKIGGSRARIGMVLVSEIVVVLVLAVILAGGLTLLTASVGSTVIRSLILS
jgi:putative ABC transport system permease protein